MVWAQECELKREAHAVMFRGSSYVLPVGGTGTRDLNRDDLLRVKMILSKTHQLPFIRCGRNCHHMALLTWNTSLDVNVSSDVMRTAPDPAATSPLIFSTSQQFDMCYKSTEYSFGISFGHQMKGKWLLLVAAGSAPASNYLHWLLQCFHY